MRVGWLGERGRPRTLWVILLVAAGVAVWLLAQHFRVAVVVRAVAAAAAVVIPILAGQFITGFFSRDSELTKALAQHLRGYDRHRGIPTVRRVRQLSLLGVTESRDARASTWTAIWT
jgi:hypothetical protein